MEGHRHRVLIVEDHDDSRNVLAALLGLYDVDVLSARDGNEALDALRAGPECCVVLLDWRMPRLDGRAFLVAQAADPALAQVPVIVVSGESLPLAATASKSVRGILSKPLDAEGLVPLLAGACIRRRRVGSVRGG
jgi:CheY-like chemotaxis protein